MQTNEQQQTGITDIDREQSLPAVLRRAEASLCHAYHTTGGTTAEHYRADVQALAQINARLPELVAATRFAIKDAWPGAARRLRRAWQSVGVEL